MPINNRQNAVTAAQIPLTATLRCTFDKNGPFSRTRFSKYFATIT